MIHAEILSSIEGHYGPLPKGCREVLETQTQILELDKGTPLVQAGQISDKTYYVAQGVARAYLLKDGRDISDWFAFEHEFISPIHSYFRAVPSPHFIETVEPSILLEINQSTLRHLTDTYREFDRMEKEVVIRTFLNLQQRIASMQFESAQQKYQSLLEMRPDITQRVPLIHIASYLGITIETLSRIRSPKAR
ncbi:Crp/Fnr family transcriptional regulator [Pontibacter sp. G13]|uniref:Crp/Fnr family transcriptional regulator n=1 Tax=Pontibacter sp. G13 TaxID=3074898 RepID=UPI00288BB0C0|nr:Crp/Fnr family transcriptional regulator [Pontibacter sp. G13]WNJ17107.1 Crp/Fnr family transcriptional regulator [Pontibacter sp. G13]